MNGSSHDTREIPLQTSVSISIAEPNNSREQTFTPGTYLIGRRSPCLIRISDPSVSGRHLLLQVTPEGTVFAKDLESTNGTRINGSRIDTEKFVPFVKGDTLKLGNTNLEINKVNAIKHPPP